MVHSIAAYLLPPDPKAKGGCKGGAERLERPSAFSVSQENQSSAGSIQFGGQVIGLPLRSLLAYPPVARHHPA